MGQALLLIADVAGECMGHDASCCSCMLGWCNPDLARMIATAHLAVLPQGQCWQADASAAARYDCWQPLWRGRFMQVGSAGGSCGREQDGALTLRLVQSFCCPVRGQLSNAKCNPCQSNSRRHIRPDATSGAISGQCPTQLLRLRPGRRACLCADAMPGQWWHGCWEWRSCAGSPHNCITA